MSVRLQLQYWRGGEWFVGRLPQAPEVFSQGATLEEMEENVRAAYRMMLEEQDVLAPAETVHNKEIDVTA